MRTVVKISEMRALAEEWRCDGQSIGLVPTMGALHEGHLSLIRRARVKNQRVVVSIFVNQLQFGPREDWARYPRQHEQDLALLNSIGIDAVFLPAAEEMHRPGNTTRVHVGALGNILEGASRPGHFEGVATVVIKLFNICRPHSAYFGQKDAQQETLITKVARELDTGVEVNILPIVRDFDGLALSSRNAYLSIEERTAAVCLSQALRSANRLYLSGERDINRLKNALVLILRSEPLVRVDYAEVVDSESFTSDGAEGANLAVIAVRIGQTRLIDNHRLGEAWN